MKLIYAESSSNVSKVDLDFNLEPLARDLDPSDLQYLLEKDSSGAEDKDLDLEGPFPIVTKSEVEETVVGPPSEQVKRIVDLQ